MGVNWICAHKITFSLASTVASGGFIVTEIRKPVENMVGPRRLECSPWLGGGSHLAIKLCGWGAREGSSHQLVAWDRH